MIREKRTMTAAMHHLFERRPLAGAAGVGLVVHVGAVLGLLLVVRAGAEPFEEQIEVIPLDDERVRSVAAEIERVASPVIMGPSMPITQPGPRPREARYIGEHQADAPKETRARAARVAATTAPRPLPVEPRGEGGPQGALVPASAVMQPGPGERAPVATSQEPPPPPAPPRGASAKAAAPPRKVAAVEAPILAAPAVIAPMESEAVVRVRQSAMARFMRQIEAAISQHWFPQSVYGRVDPSGNIRGVERRTALRVRVRADGTLERLDIESSSGVAALDEEAMAAFHRAKPFPHPPGVTLDSKGGLTFPFSVTLDLELARFKSDVKRMVGATWRPRGRLYIDMDRITVVRALLNAEGVVAHSTVESTSGNSFLDGSALSAISAGMRLPRPPRSVGEVAGMVPLRIAFVHRFRGEHDLQVLIDRSDE
jgi:protein TonB